MLLTTTSHIENKSITEYLGLVTSEVIIGANFVKDFMASITDFFGGRSSSYEKTLQEAKSKAIEELIERAKSLGANGVIGIDIDYETMGQNGSMLMVVISGTAIRFQ